MARNVRLEGKWDTQRGAAPGWHVEVIDDATGEIVCDSQKVSFGVDVDRFGRGQRGALMRALRAEYPGAAEITIAN